MFDNLLLKIILSLLLGGLIGIDREKRHKGYPAGIRTSALLSLIGLLTTYLSELINNSYLLIVSLFFVLIFISLVYYNSLRKNKSIGWTTILTLILIFFIGVLCNYEKYQYYSISLSIFISLILSQKEILHHFVRVIGKKELLDALLFGIIAFVMLPLLPKTTIDPFNVLIPYDLWFMVVLILFISFLGYIVSKLFGQKKGIFLSAITGGLISSTAVTTTLSIKSKKNKKISLIYIAGITAASSIMFIRILSEVFILNYSLGFKLIIPFFSSAIIGLIISFIVYKNSNSKINEDFSKQSPLYFGPAFKFLLLIIIILISSKLLNNYFGDKGLYLTSIFGGLIDTDAITISTINMFNMNNISIFIAKRMIIIASITNSIIKLLIIYFMGSKKVFKKMFIIYGVLIIPLIIFLFF